MFVAKHFDKHFCLSLGNTGLLTYKKSIRQFNNPAICRKFLIPAIAGIKLPDFFDSSSSKIKFSLKENLTYIFKDIILSGIMNQEKIKEYKNKLERERILLLAEIKRNETPVDFGSDTDDESDETENFGNQLAMIQGLKDRLNEIDIALNKIRSEGYGICEKCGKEIEEAILDTDPESRYCKKCKLSEPRS